MTLDQFETTHWERIGSYPADSPPASLDAAQACCGLCVWFYEQTTIERLDPDQEGMA